MFLNGIEETFINKGIAGIDIATINLCLILNADNILIFSQCAEGLRN